MCCWRRQLAAQPSLRRLQMFEEAGFCLSGSVTHDSCSITAAQGEIAFSALMRPSNGGKVPVLKPAFPFLTVVRLASEQKWRQLFLSSAISYYFLFAPQGPCCFVTRWLWVMHHTGQNPPPTPRLSDASIPSRKAVRTCRILLLWVAFVAMCLNLCAWKEI